MEKILDRKLEDKIKGYFSRYNKVSVAFSGGVDSSLVLKLATMYCKEAKGYYVKSQFQPQFELEDAIRLKEDIKAQVEFINLNILEFNEVTDNPKNRCYFCKKNIFKNIIDYAKKDGFLVVMDGTNFSDDRNDRPGMKALDELKVISPLRELELTKEDVRKLSKELNLFTHDKPSYSCLATRIKTLEKIDANKLNKIEEAEKILFSLGLQDFRVRLSKDVAKIEIKEKDIEKLIKNRDIIYLGFSELFKEVLLDLKWR